MCALKKLIIKTLILLSKILEVYFIKLDLSIEKIMLRRQLAVVKLIKNFVNFWNLSHLITMSFNDHNHRLT